MDHMLSDLLIVHELSYIARNYVALAHYASSVVCLRFHFAVRFLCAFFVCRSIAFCAFACAFTNVGAFSHGLDRCTISLRLAVISLAANGCVRGISYLAR
jgi:hypothetical protein